MLSSLSLFCMSCRDGTLAQCSVLAPHHRGEVKSKGLLHRKLAFFLGPVTCSERITNTVNRGSWNVLLGSLLVFVGVHRAAGNHRGKWLTHSVVEMERFSLPTLFRRLRDWSAAARRVYILQKSNASLAHFFTMCVWFTTGLIIDSDFPYKAAHPLMLRCCAVKVGKKHV